MSKKIIAIAAGAIVASAAYADIQITENLSVAGFVDMSWTNASGELESATTGSPTSVTNTSADSFAVDQVEFQFMFDFDQVTGEVHIQGVNGNTTSGGGIFDATEVETAFATYHFSDSFSVTAGRYFSMLGFEAEEPTGLYQYSLAYDMAALIPGHNNGIKVVMEGENGFFGLSLQDALLLSDEVLGGNGNVTGAGFDGYAIELAGAFTGVEGLTLFGGIGFEGGEETGFTPASGENTDIESWVLDFYAVYEVGALTLAGEFVFVTTDDIDPYLSGVGTGLAGAGVVGIFTPAFPAGVFSNGFDVDADYFAWQLLANFAFNDQWAITGRISGESLDMGTSVSNPGFEVGEADSMKLTISPSYAWSDNLLSLFEYSYTDYEQETTFTGGSTNVEGDEHLFAFETIFSW